jgi:hypothetical protein
MTRPKIVIHNHYAKSARDAASEITAGGEKFYLVDDFGGGAVYENQNETKWAVSKGGQTKTFSTRSAARAHAKGS